MISLIAGVVTTIVLFSVGSSYAIALGLVVAILDLIPLAGATLAAIIVSAVIFVEQGIVRGIIVVIFFVLYQQLENHILQPVIYGRTVQLSPLAVLVAVLIGAESRRSARGPARDSRRRLGPGDRQGAPARTQGEADRDAAGRCAPCSERLGLVERLDAGDPVEHAVVARQAVEAEAAVDVVVRPVVALEHVVPGPSEEDVLARVTLDHVRSASAPNDVRAGVPGQDIRASEAADHVGSSRASDHVCPCGTDDRAGLRPDIHRRMALGDDRDGRDHERGCDEGEPGEQKSE